MRRALLIFLTASAAGGGDEVVACTTEARPGLSVTVRDAVSGLAVTSDVEVVARDGAYADTARSSLIASGVYVLAIERRGTYDVTVVHPAYRRWTRSNVVVGADQCHVRTVSLVVLLQPAV